MDPVTAVGLALAIAPLLITALEEYHSAVLKIKQSVLYDSTMKKLIRSLDGAMIEFGDNLNKLLQAAVPGEGHIKTSSELWKSKSTVKKIEEYLGERKYGYIQRTVSEYEDCLCDVGKEFGHFLGAPKGKKLSLEDLEDLLSKNPKGVAHSKKFLSPITKRAWLLIKQSTLVRMTDGLDKLNSDMDRHLENSEKLHSAETQIIVDIKQATALDLMLQQVRTRAEKLFHAFLKAWKPDCHPSHHALLFLDTPAFPQKKKTSLTFNASQYRFRVVLQKPATKTGEGQCWRETYVTVLDLDGDDDGFVSNTPNSNVPQTTQTPSATPTILITTTKGPIQKPGQGSIIDICKDIVCAKASEQVIDLHLHCGKGFIYPDSTSSPIATPLGTTIYDGGILTLNKLLSPPNKVPMHPKQKVSLAFKLATSLLQLKTSQWLRMDWTKPANQVITFFLPTTPHAIEVEQPLIPQLFSNEKQEEEEKCPKSMFLELGILLLEIWNEKTLEEWTKENHPTTLVTEYTRDNLVNRWHEASVTKMTPRYGKAIGACLSFAFDYHPTLPSWDDRDIRITICAKIIQPLQEELEDTS